VIGTEVASNLFASNSVNPIGQTVQINRIPFTIIGVLKSQGSSGMTNNDDRILIPITTAMSRLTGGKNVGTIYVSAKSSDQMEQAQLDIASTLRLQHNLRPQAADDFRITSQSDILSAAQEVSRFSVTWREAARIMKKIKMSNLRYRVRQMEGKSSVAFVFPRVSVSQYVYLYILFGPRAADVAGGGD